MRFKCVAVISYEVQVDADSADEAEQNVFESLADDVTQGIIRTDLFDTSSEYLAVPTLRAVAVCCSAEC